MSRLHPNGGGKEINSGEDAAASSCWDGVKSCSHQGGNSCSSLEQLKLTASAKRAETHISLWMLTFPHYYFCVSLVPVPSVCAAYTHNQLEAVAAHVFLCGSFLPAHIYMSRDIEGETDMGAHKPKHALCAHEDAARLRSTACSTSSIQSLGCFSYRRAHCQHGEIASGPS